MNQRFTAIVSQTKLLTFAKYLVNDNDHNIKGHEKRKHNINRFNDQINTSPVYLLDIMLINAVIGLVTVV